MTPGCGEHGVHLPAGRRKDANQRRHGVLLYIAHVYVCHGTCHTNVRGQSLL